MYTTVSQVLIDPSEPSHYVVDDVFCCKTPLPNSISATLLHPRTLQQSFQELRTKDNVELAKFQWEYMAHFIMLGLITIGSDTDTKKNSVYFWSLQQTIDAFGNTEYGSLFQFNKRTVDLEKLKLMLNCYTDRPELKKAIKDGLKALANDPTQISPELWGFLSRETKWLVLHKSPDRKHHIMYYRTVCKNFDKHKQSEL